jgi:hypothetical protein
LALYLASDAKRQADATYYTVKKGVSVKGSDLNIESKDGTCIDDHCYVLWGLRTPGYFVDDSDIYSVAYVDFDGSYNSGGCNVSRTDIGVRPAMWIQY